MLLVVLHSLPMGRRCHNTPLISLDVFFDLISLQVAWISLAQDGYESDQGFIFIHDLEKDVRFTVDFEEVDKDYVKKWDRSPNLLTVCSFFFPRYQTCPHNYISSSHSMGSLSFSLLATKHASKYILHPSLRRLPLHPHLNMTSTKNSSFPPPCPPLSPGTTQQAMPRPFLTADFSSRYPPFLARTTCTLSLV